MAPLTALTKKSALATALLKKEGPMNSFKTLVSLFTSSPFLLHLDFNKPRVLQVDCSGVALSGILSQTDENNYLCPVAYHSKKLTPAEQHWQVHDHSVLSWHASWNGGVCWRVLINLWWYSLTMQTLSIS